MRTRGDKEQEYFTLARSIDSKICFDASYLLVKESHALVCTIPFSKMLLKMQRCTRTHTRILNKDALNLFCRM